MPIPVLSVEEIRRWEEASWRAGKRPAEVIALAGKSLALQALAMTSPKELILLLCGKGHNGDDVRAAKKHLDGRAVKLLSVGDPKRDSAKLEALLGEKPSLIVDGLFGIGLNRPLNQAWQQFIGKINESGIPVLAADVPSGLNADTGAMEGAAIKAAVTLTMGAPKRGLLKTNALTFTGRLVVATEIGLLAPPPGEASLNWLLAEDFKNYPPSRATQANKGDYGRLAIIAGSAGYHGAAVLTSRGAQRAHPGLITVHTMPSAYVPVASQAAAVMVQAWTAKWQPPDNTNAILIGPGLAAKPLPANVKTLARELWKSAQFPVIVDASALDWLVAGKNSGVGARVITPHPGEAARLLGTTAAKVQANRVESLRAISKKLGNCWVVLKGAQTLIGRATGAISVNSSGNPFLAQGGSGDLLAGYLAGLLAQSELQRDIGKTLAYGVWQHGAAADFLTKTRRNWIVEDLAAEIGREF